MNNKISNAFKGGSAQSETAGNQCRNTQSLRKVSPKLRVVSSNTERDPEAYSKPGTQLLPRHLDHIKARAISPWVARMRGYFSVEDPARLKTFGFGRKQLQVPALVLPVFNTRGEPVGAQSRPDSPRIDEDGKPVKYDTRKGMSMLVDVHPFLSAPRDGRVSRIADPAEPLVITEGIFKEDAAIGIQLICVGLLGVWSWRGTNSAGGATALADWEDIAFKGPRRKKREVYICFDSDVMTKKGVYQSLFRLKSFLESRGARV